MDDNTNPPPPSSSSPNYYRHSPSHSPSPSRTIYNDRFIRSSSNFPSFDISTPPPPPTDNDNPSSYIRTALFGSDIGFVDNKNSPASHNIFRFKRETQQSLSPFGLPAVSPTKVVPKSPYKNTTETEFGASSFGRTQIR